MFPKMAHIEYDPIFLKNLKEKVVVLTGGASGIGKAAVRIFYGTAGKLHGASVY